MKYHNESNIIDLFSGVGGLSLGAARAGFLVRGAIDVDERANAAHKRNFPNTAHIHADISKLSGKELVESLTLNGEGITGVIGGPPCQGFSNIGKKDKYDVRNRSFVEFFRIVAEIRPKFFLVENVPGIMRSNFEDIREKAITLVDSQYSILPPMYLAANDYGAATSRRRVFFFGYRSADLNPISINCFKAPPNLEKVRVKSALFGLPQRIVPWLQSEKDSWRVVGDYLENNFGQRLRGFVPKGVGDKTALLRLSNKQEVSGFMGTKHSKEVVNRYSKTECGKYDSISRAYRLNPNDFCPTIRAGTGPDKGSFQAVRPIHPKEDRVITPREAARLQGFPDWFQFDRTKWHSFRQIGNSVSPILAEYVLGVVAIALDIPRPTKENYE